MQDSWGWYSIHLFSVFPSQKRKAKRGLQTAETERQTTSSKYNIRGTAFSCRDVSMERPFWIWEHERWHSRKAPVFGRFYCGRRVQCLVFLVNPQIIFESVQTFSWDITLKSFWAVSRSFQGNSEHESHMIPVWCRLRVPIPLSPFGSPSARLRMSVFLSWRDL